MNMKTAISVPDKTFESAEQIAKRLGMSRSELYTKAVSSYIKEHRNYRVTEILNKVYSEEDSSIDKAIQRLQAASVSEDEW